jgi:hypothetical protein
VAEDGSYRVRLFFAEPDQVNAGERTMEISLQGSIVLKDLDLSTEAEGPRRLLVRDFEAETDDGEIVIGLAARGSLPTIISGVELIRVSG